MSRGYFRRRKTGVRKGMVFMEEAQKFSNHLKNLYCLWIKTGFEEDFIKQIQPVLDSDFAKSKCSGKLIFLGKQMRLKSGKEYIDPLFPGYVFFESNKIQDFTVLQEGKGFVKILPENTKPQPLCEKDTELVYSFLKYGPVIPICHVQFNVNDRIEILDGPFKGKEGHVVAVNRRNKRVNVEVSLMNGMHVLGLTYEVIKKREDCD